jgi:hypothetical protein
MFLDAGVCEVGAFQIAADAIDDATLILATAAGSAARPTEKCGSQQQS